MLCPKCAHPLDDGDLFCRFCGCSLSSGTEEPADPPEAEAMDDPPIAELSPESDDGSESPEVPLEDLEAPSDPSAEAPNDPTAEALSGTPSDAPSAVSYDTPSPAPAAPKGAFWPPVMIMAVMICVGLLFFFFFPGKSTQPVMEYAWFSVSDGEVTFHAELYSGSSEVTVPAVIRGQKVIGLADGCFAGCENISTVILPDSLQYVGSSAFSGCSSLRGIYLPDSVQSVGEQAFFRCNHLEAVYIGAGVQSIGSDAFFRCITLRHIFFNGTSRQWVELYSESIGPQARVYAADGVFIPN